MRRWPVLLSLIVAASILAVALRPEKRLVSYSTERKPPVSPPFERDRRVDDLQAEVAALRAELERVRTEPGGNVAEEEERLRRLVRQAREEWRRSEWEHHLDAALDLEMPRIAERLGLASEQTTRVRAILREAAAPVVDAVRDAQAGRLEPAEFERLVDPAQRWGDEVDRRLSEILTPAQREAWQAYKRESAAR